MKILVLLYKTLGIFKHNVLVSIFGISSYCKHKPTCSEYFYQQLKKRGTIEGLFQAIRRLLTCW